MDRPMIEPAFYSAENEEEMIQSAKTFSIQKARDGFYELFCLPNCEVVYRAKLRKTVERLKKEAKNFKRSVIN
jgi:hypothetical protein